jgi:hypothetical protein
MSIGLRASQPRIYELFLKNSFTVILNEVKDLELRRR